jgi:DNA invertase Pin-like site-specific DNA recombinase
VTLAGARCAVYARFSTDMQSSSSVEDQVARARRYVEERGGRVDEALVFVDFALSGATTARPGLQALLAAVDARRLDVALVESLDRVSRDQADVHMIFRRLRAADVRLIGIGDGIDTSTGQAGRMLASMRAMMGEAYLDDLRDKTRRGLEARARAGLATGGLPFGYRSSAHASGGRAIEIDPAAADIVRRIFADHARGASFAGIATALNAELVPPPRSSRRLRAPTWQHTTIRSILKNERYRGVLVFGQREWRKVPDTQLRRPVLRSPHAVVRIERPELRIVDDETWSACNPTSSDRPARAAERRAGARRAYLFSGLLRCGLCGSTMHVHGGRDRSYYRCAEAASRGTCENRASVAEDVVRPGLLEAIAERIWSPTTAAAVRAIVEGVLASDTSSAELGAARRALAVTEQRRDRLVEALAGDTSGAAPASVLGAIRDLEGRARVERGRVAELEGRARTASLPSADELLERMRRLSTGLDQVERVDVARERLRALLRGPVTLTPEGDRYVARAEILPLVLLGMSSARAGGDVRLAGARLTQPATAFPALSVTRDFPIARRAA